MANSRFAGLFRLFRRKKRPRVSKPAAGVRLEIETLERREVPAGTWTALANLPPSSTVGTMMLLSDGTVMVQGGNVTKSWYKLTPDSTGSYINGTWSTLAPMGTARLYFASNVLPDGRVLVLGGEYSGSSGAQNWTNTGEIYNPVTNSWSSIANFPRTQFGDDPSEVLPDGTVLAGYLSGASTYIYNPTSNAWTQTGTKQNNDRSDEETWIKLPNGNILSYSIFSSISSGTSTAQQYVPSTNSWISAGTLPVQLSSATVPGDNNFFEVGPGLLLPDGRVFQLGGINTTALYTPTTNTWVQGPSIPNNGTKAQGADDAPAAIMPNGQVIFAVDTPFSTKPTQLFDFDPTSNSLSPMTGLPSGLTNELNANGAFVSRMLMLPNGDMLFDDFSNQLWEYSPGGAPDPSWQPTITSIAGNGNGSYTLTGTQLNGISEGASYGDDAEMSSNYPIVRLVSSGGQVAYARTANWSSTGVATGSTLETTVFTPPAGFNLNGSTQVYVVANGIASNEFNFNVIGPYFTVSSATSTGAGAPTSVTVTAFDQNNNLLTSYAGTVQITSSDRQAGLPANATLTNGVGVFTITLKTAGSQTLTATDSVTSSITGSSGPISVSAALTSHFTLSAPSAIAAGSLRFTVSAQDAFNNVTTSYNGIVGFTSSDSRATLPPNTALTNGVGIFSATLKSVGSQTLAATDVSTSTILGASSAIAVSAGPAAEFMVTVPASTTAGNAFTVTVTALDQFNNTASEYAGTIQFTTSDLNGLANLPGAYTFTQGDLGQHTFINGVSLVTAGPQTLNASDIGNGSVNGTSNAINISAGSAVQLTINNSSSATAGNAFRFTVTADDPFGNTAASYTGTVAFASNDTAAALPGNGTLTNGVGTFSATFKTTGNRTLTATDAAVSSISGASNTIVVSPGAASHFVVASPGTATAGGAFSLTVTAKDVFNNTATNYSGTLILSSSDAKATLPAASSLTSGVGSFSATLTTDATQVLTATDRNTASIAGTSAPIAVSPAGAAHFALSASGTATAGSGFRFTVTAQDPFNNTASGYSGSVQFTGTDSKSVLPAIATLTAGVGIFSATLVTAGGQVLTATDTTSSAIAGSAAINVIATAASHFSVTGPGTASAGLAATVTVQALDQFNNSAPNYNGTVIFSSSDVAATLPAGGKLISGVGAFSLTLETLGSQTVIASDKVTGSINGGAAILVNRPPATHFAVSAPAGTLTAGNAGVITVTALDQFNQQALSYSGTVTFTSSDSGAILPSASTLLSGVGVFSATLVTAGSQTLTATDATTITGSTTVSVTAAAAKILLVAGPPVAVNGTAFNLTVTAKDQFGNVATGYSGIVHYTSSDTGATLPLDGKLTSGIGIFGATLATVGNQSVTAADALNSNITPGSATITVPVTLSIPTNLTGGQGGTVTVPINVNALDDPASSFAQSGLSGGDFVLYYNPSVFSVSNADVQLGTIATPSPTDPLGTAPGDGYSPAANNGWTVAPTSSIPGYLNIVLSNVNSSGAFTGTGGGSLVTVNFHVLPNAPPGPSRIDLAADTGGFGNAPATTLNDSLDSVQASLAYNIYPVPQDNTVFSPAYGYSGPDPVDGIVTIGQPTTHFTLSAPSVAQAGHPATFTVTARDQFNNVASDYTGAVRFTSSDSRAVLADSGPLTSGVGVFAAVLESAGNQTLSVTDTASPALAGTSNSISVTAGAVNHLVVGLPANATAGTAINSTVTAIDQYGNTVLTYNGTDQLSSSDSFAQLPQFLALSGGTGTFSATLQTSGNDVISATDIGASNVNGIAVVHVNAASASHFVVSAPATGIAGIAFGITVTAEDRFNNIATGYNGTVSFSSSDHQATLGSGLPNPPATLISGTGLFATVLKTAGVQTITVSDTLSSGITGTTNPIVVSAAANATHFAFAYALPVYPGITTGPNSFATTGVPLTFTVTAVDAFGNIVPTYAGTVQFNTSDTLAALGGGLPTSPATLTSGMGAFSVTLATAGTQTVTATDSGNAITGTSGAIVTRGLVVTSLTPTPTGFTAQFNKAFVASTVNLYTSGALPDNVILATTGSQVSVRGSVVFSPPPNGGGSPNGSSPSGFTFVKTATATGTGAFNPASGLLSAGIYTVTLRSYSASGGGFKDLLGAALDGTDDGTSGGSFQATFSVSAPPVAVGIPAFARGPSNTDAIFFSTGLADGSIFNLSYTNPAANPTTGTATVTFSSSAAVLASNIQTALSSGSLAPQVGLNGSTPNSVVIVTNDTSAGANVVVTFQSALGQATSQLLTSSTPGVSISAATINVPNNIPGSGIPIALSSGLGVTSGSFTLQYDPSLLTITGAVSKIAGATFTLVSNNTVTGTAVLSLSSPSAISTTATAITLGSLLATVPLSAAANYGGKALLHFSSAQLAGSSGPLAVTNQDAVQVAAYFGDVTDAGGPFTLQDAGAIASVAGTVSNTAAQTIPGFDAFPDLDPVIIGDVALQGSVNSTDVGAMNQQLGGTARITIPYAPNNLPVNGPAVSSPISGVRNGVSDVPGPAADVGNAMAGVLTPDIGLRPPDISIWTSDIFDLRLLRRHRPALIR